MKVAELLSLLSQKCLYVAPLSLPQEQRPGLTGPFILNVIKQHSDNTVVNQTIKIYVKDLNMDTEEVFFDGYNPLQETTASTTFEEEVRQYLKALVQSQTYDYVTLEEANVETERAFARAYKVKQDESLTETVLIIYRTEGGSLEHKEASVA